MAGIFRLSVITALFLLVVEPVPALACTGGQAGVGMLTFVQSDSIVVVATMGSYVGKDAAAWDGFGTMVIQVAETLYGSVNTKELRIRVHNDLAPLFVTSSSIGTSRVLHLEKIRKMGGDYTLFPCGEHWLPLEAGRVRGYIVQGAANAPEMTMSLSELRWRLQELAAGRKAMQDSWKK